MAISDLRKFSVNYQHRQIARLPEREIFKNLPLKNE
jgi:hypothetical protein